jgi:hypothetical protein
MRETAVILAVLALAIFCGCVSEGNEYTCPDGTTVSGLDECPLQVVTVPTLGLSGKIQECSQMREGEYKYACFTNIAVDSSDLSICDKIGKPVWKRYCYGKLNMSALLGPEETTTTLSQTELALLSTTTSTTTTTILCGNGHMDSKEECDMGNICPDADGVCTITATSPSLAVCLYNTTCEWSTQTAVIGDYDMGECNGCYGWNNSKGCMCLDQTVINKTVKPAKKGNVMNDTQFAEKNVGKATATTLADTYSECQDGLCRKVKGNGKNECNSDSACRHYTCISEKCTLIRSPGSSGCKSDIQCLG